jgi:UDP-N-acetylmuramate dehydrogenase
VGAGDVEAAAHAARDALSRPARRPGAPREWGPASVRALARDLRRALGASRVLQDEPLAPRTGLRVGGAADVFVGVADEGDLRALLAWTHSRGVPFTLLGGGFNVLVSDLGVRGVTARLEGAGFRALREEHGCVRAGAGLPLARLVAWAARRPAGGYAFLQGIPGTLGGAARMNAGAWGHYLGERMVRIRGLNRDGSETIVGGGDMGLAYRNCALLEEVVLLEAALALEPGDREEIRAERGRIAARRAWMNGLRSAGSVFKNPPGAYAGRLLEEAGFRGVRLGGAEIAATHANFLFTRPGATASDARALTERMRAAVARRTGVELEMEVRMLT